MSSFASIAGCVPLARANAWLPDVAVLARGLQPDTGTIARVSATPSASTIGVELDSGRTVIFDPAKYNRLDWGRASTTFKAQGADDPTVFASIAPPKRRDLRTLR